MVGMSIPDITRRRGVALRDLSALLDWRWEGKRRAHLVRMGPSSHVPVLTCKAATLLQIAADDGFDLSTRNSV